MINKMNESIPAYCSNVFLLNTRSLPVCVAVILLALIAMPLSADEQIRTDEVGQVTLVIGQALAHNKKGEHRSLNRADAVYVGETIETSSGGHVHLHFIDDGAISLRPNSRLNIELYHYDKLQPKNSVIRFNLETGVVRSISGKATEAAHDRFRLNTPIAAIGVLGTDFVVRAESEKMWAGVYSGAIAIATLNEQCSVNGLGACGGATRLSEAMGSVMIEFNGRREKEKIVPLDPAIISKATSSGSDNPVAPKENLSQAAPGRLTVAEIKVNDAANSLGNTQSSVQQPLSPVQQPLPPVQQPLPPIQQPLPPVQQPSPFSWARWGSQLPGDAMSKPYAEAREGRVVTIGNAYYALFRAPSASAGLEPRSGVYDFKLQQGQVHFVGNRIPWQTQEISLAKLNAATLQIDFAQRQFNTHLEMSHPQAGSATLNLSGAVQDNGIFKAQDAAGKVAGALSPEGEHAGMLFERNVQSGTFHGLTDWVKQ
jgi:hypothetical protein